jgi:ankyrin repeat protein
LLIAAGADLGQRTMLERWDLVTLARNSNFDRLAKRFIDLDEETRALEIPDTLVGAILTGELRIVRLFRRRQPDTLNAPVNEQGWTPLLVAINKGHFAMAEHFIQQGADVNQANGAGETPLYQAVVKGHIATVRCLLAAGADIRISSHGMTLREVAKRVGNRPIYDLLKRHAKRMAELEAS